jgi:hypothetical protein
VKWNSSWAGRKRANIVSPSAPCLLSAQRCHVTAALPATVLTTDDASAAPPRPPRLHRRPRTVERLGPRAWGSVCNSMWPREATVSLGNLSATAGVFLDRRQGVSWAGGRQHVREAWWCWVVLGGAGWCWGLGAMVRARRGCVHAARVWRCSGCAHRLATIQAVVADHPTTSAQCFVGCSRLRLAAHLCSHHCRT